MNDEPQHEPLWVDVAISNLLRAGVIISMAVVVIGLVFTFVHHPQYVRSTSDLGRLTDADVLYPHRLRDVADQIGHGRGQAIVMLGLLMLIATPVARVAFSIVAFALERDRLYVTITSVVLALLIVSFLVGAAE
ncbi:MAG TPA: DUF1634 domain-containing protein [Thermoanaerobaculia bacterium]